MENKEQETKQETEQDGSVKDVSETAGDQKDQPTLTFGQKAVGVSFNPSKDPLVDEIKALAAEFIDKCHALRSESIGPSEKGRYLSTAITYTEIACMEAVKAITWPH